MFVLFLYPISTLCRQIYVFQQFFCAYSPAISAKRTISVQSYYKKCTYARKRALFLKKDRFYLSIEVLPMRSLGVYSLVIYHRPTTAKRTTNYSSPCERSIIPRYQLAINYGRYTVDIRYIHGRYTVY